MSPLIRFHCDYKKLLCFKIIDGERFDVHVILDDPAGNSYVQVISILELFWLNGVSP